MKKSKNNIKKNVEQHTLEARSTDHHLEISEDNFPTLLDHEGTLADCYIKIIENEFKRSGRN